MTTSGLSGYDDSNMRYILVGTSDGSTECLCANSDSNNQFTVTISWTSPVQVGHVIIFKGFELFGTKVANAKAEINFNGALSDCGDFSWDDSVVEQKVTCP